MKKKVNFITFIILTVLFVVLFNIGIADGNFISYDTIGVKYRYDDAVILEHGEFSYNKPTLILFGGVGERDSIDKTYRLVDKVPTIENCNLVCVALYNDQTRGKVEDWISVCDGVYEFLIDKITAGVLNPSNIYIDGYSNGGAGAYFCFQKLHNTYVTIGNYKSRILVKKVTFIDGAYNNVITDDAILDIIESGTLVCIYVAGLSNYNISKNGLKLLNEFGCNSSVDGEVLECGHGQKITKLIYEEPYNNHEQDFKTKKKLFVIIDS